MKTVHCDRPRCDVIAASPRVISDVIRSPLPVCASAQDGGTERRERRRDVITRSCDVSTASTRDVIRSPLPFSGHAQDGGTGSERRRRFPKMGRSCLLESLRQRGDSVEANSASTPPRGLHVRASLSPKNATKSPSTGCACATDLRHSAVTSWTRDLSHLPILRDTTV